MKKKAVTANYNEDVTEFPSTAEKNCLETSVRMVSTYTSLHHWKKDL